MFAYIIINLKNHRVYRTIKMFCRSNSFQQPINQPCSLNPYPPLIPIMEAVSPNDILHTRVSKSSKLARNSESHSQASDWVGQTDTGSHVDVVGQEVHVNASNERMFD